MLVIKTFSKIWFITRGAYSTSFLLALKIAQFLFSNFVFPFLNQSFFFSLNWNIFILNECQTTWYNSSSRVVISFHINGWYWPTRVWFVTGFRWLLSIRYLYFSPSASQVLSSGCRITFFNRSSNDICIWFDYHILTKTIYLKQQPAKTSLAKTTVGQNANY